MQWGGQGVTQARSWAQARSQASEEERRIDSKLVKLKLGKIMEVIQTPRIAELLDVVR